MRNIKNYVVAAFALFLLDGCDFLDYDETSGKTKAEAYSYFNRYEFIGSLYIWFLAD